VELEPEESPRNKDAEVHHQQEQVHQGKFSEQTNLADMLVGNIGKRIKPGKTLLVIFDCKLFQGLDKSLMNFLLTTVTSVLNKAS